jgi:hypothetical protein
MRTVREITAELAESGLSADQMALVTELAMVAATSSRSKHAQAQARYHAKKKERSDLIISDHMIISDQHDAPPSSPSASLPLPLPPITPIPFFLSSPPSSSSPCIGRSKPTRPERDEKFEEFKQAYPKRKGANPWKPAQALFERAILAGTSADQIIAAAKSGVGYDREKVGTEYIPQAVKWLRDQRWQDLPTASPVNERPAYMTPPPGCRSYEEEMSIYGDDSDAQIGAEIRSDGRMGKERSH